MRVELKTSGRDFDDFGPQVGTVAVAVFSMGSDDLSTAVLGKVGFAICMMILRLLLSRVQTKQTTPKNRHKGVITVSGGQ